MKERHVPDGATSDTTMFPSMKDWDGATKDPNVVIFQTGKDIVELANINELFFGKPQEEDNERE